MQERAEHSAVADMAAKRDVFERLSELRGSRTIIVGVGNILKGDDGAGPVLCGQLSGRTCAELVDAGTVPENYIHRIIERAPENLVVIDAVDFGASAGTVRAFEPEQLSSSAISTHSLSPRLFADMVSQALDVDVCFVGIQPAHVRLGESLSPQVSRAVKELADVLAGVFRPGGRG